jgi:hypothetical protein
LGIFLPGISIHPLPRKLEGSAEIAAFLVVIDQPTNGGQHLTLELFPCEQCPLLKSGAIGDGEAFQKLAPVQSHGFLELSSARFAALEQGLKRPRVKPMITLSIDLYRLVGDVQKRGGSVAISDYLA